jgi:hypothetical protein
MTKKSIARAVKIGWSTAAVALLLLALYLFNVKDARPNSDAGVPMIYGMFLLSFPSGLGVMTLSSWLIIRSGSEGAAESNSHLVQVWLVMAVAGYLQWFVLIPWLVRKWQARRLQH